jgi:phasin
MMAQARSGGWTLVDPANLQDISRGKPQDRSAIMTKVPHTPFEASGEMRSFAEQSFEQAKLAFDKFMSAAQVTIDTVEGQSKAAQAGAREVSVKVMGFAEQNMANAFAYAQKLLQAKDPQTLMQMHQEFIRSQLQTLSEQAKAVSEAASKATLDAARPKV